MKTVFVPGLRLSEEFYREIVQPILDNSFLGQSHTAGLIDGGSEENPGPTDKTNY